MFLRHRPGVVLVHETSFHLSRQVGRTSVPAGLISWNPFENDVMHVQCVLTSVLTIIKVAMYLHMHII